MARDGEDGLPEGVFSFLDTDLYKLTMQCAVLKYFPAVHVTYAFTNRTPHMRLSRKAFDWLSEQISKLGNISLSQQELDYLKNACPYLNDPYLRYLKAFSLRPSEQVTIAFTPSNDSGQSEELGDVHMEVAGLWVEAILYEIPLLALTSEAYFKFCDTEWTYDRQEEKAYGKGIRLLENDCVFSEFGTRRRRDYHTQDMVIRGLKRAAKQGTCATGKGTGALSGTSNVHFAMKYNIPPVGTVAHEWFMGIAAFTNDYEHVSEIALRYWIGCFGEGVLGIALTDTFGTPVFLKAFKQPIPHYTNAAAGAASTLASAAAVSTLPSIDSLAETKPPIHAPLPRNATDGANLRSYAQVFSGVRQDSGDPTAFIRVMRDFYDRESITDKKTIVFSDSLNIELCLEYKQAAEEAGFQPTFGVGTFLTNDFLNTSSGKKSVPLNIVIKLSSAAGKPAIKISDNIGKNTGDFQTVHDAKQRLGYMEHEWTAGDEKTRWGTAEGRATTQQVST